MKMGQAEEKQAEEFDLELYTEQRMLEIDSLEDRVLYKKIVKDMMVELFSYTKQEYQNLEDRVLGEFQSRQSDYAVYLTLTDREHFDATDTFMIPMRKEDQRKAEIKTEEFLEYRKREEEFFVYTVYLEARASAVRELTAEKRLFQGVVRTNQKEYQAVFSIRKNQVYLNMIRELYDVFGTNYLSWMTVCSAYLHKMFDVILCSCEPIGKKENILEIRVDFGEYEPFIRYERIPLWNLKAFSEKTSTYPEPCVDKTNYEHRIFEHRLKADCQYLIRNTDVEIINIRRLKGDLIMTCPKPDPCNWNLYQVNKKPEKASYQYPLLTNQYRETFAGSVSELYKKSVKTKSEIARLLKSFGYQNYVVFEDVEICKEPPENIFTYSMDDFIEEEIRIGGFQQTLLVSFSEAAEHYLNEDIMSFLVTQIQKLFPEYFCVGCFV